MGRDTPPPSGQHFSSAPPPQQEHAGDPSSTCFRPPAARPRRSRNLLRSPRQQPGLQQRAPAAAGACWGSLVDNLAVSSAPPPRANLAEVEIVYTILKLYIQFQNCIYNFKTVYIQFDLPSANHSLYAVARDFLLQFTRQITAYVHNPSYIMQKQAFTPYTISKLYIQF